MPPAIKSSTQKTVPHPPLPHDGPGSFNNIHLAVLVVLAPFVAVRFVPFLSIGFYSYIFLFLLCGMPVTVAYWQIMSTYSGNVRDNVKMPNRPQSDYLEFKDPALRQEYLNKKIPMQIAYDAYFDSKLDFKGGLSACFLEHVRLIRQHMQAIFWMCWSTGMIGQRSASPWKSGRFASNASAVQNS